MYYRLLEYAVYLLIIISVFLLALQPSDVIAKATPTIEYVKVGYGLGDQVPQEVIDSLIRKYAEPSDRYLIERTIWCESRNWNIQSKVMRGGQREDSWGIGQIHLPSHTGITKEEALDVEFTIEWMAKNIHTTKWYGFNAKSDTCNN